MKHIKPLVLGCLLLAALLLCGCTGMLGISTQVGFIDRAGNMVIEPQYTSAYPFEEGLAAVMIGNASYSAWGFIDTTGQYAIEPDYTRTRVRSFYQGLCPVQTTIDKTTCWIFIDPQGNDALNLRFGNASVFVDGLAPVQSLEGAKRYGYIDISGQYVIEPQYAVASVFSHSEGLAMIRTNDGETGLCGYINRQGETLIAPKWSYAGLFSQGLAPVKLTYDQETFDWGYINTAGELLYGGGYADALGYNDGLAATAITDEQGNTLYGYLDVHGQWAIQPQYAQAGSFGEGLAPVNFGTRDDPSWGFIDVDNQVVIEGQYTVAGSFSQGLASVGVDAQ